MKAGERENDQAEEGNCQVVALQGPPGIPGLPVQMSVKKFGGKG